jgi:hypothetical protein
MILTLLLKNSMAVVMALKGRMLPMPKRII